RPDVILLDLGLPAGDGFSVLTKLKTTLPALSSIPVIVLTARDPNLNREKALAAGAEAYLLKPTDNDELLAIIAQAIRKN
ncbi:MAG TPA: response regulator, partial [bacterium]|nr:response regulator [bacterium]